MALQVRLSESVSRVVETIAAEDNVSIDAVVDDAIEAYRHARFIERVNRDFERLRADPIEWRACQDEMKIWDRTLMDGSEDDLWFQHQQLCVAAPRPETRMVVEARLGSAFGRVSIVEGKRCTGARALAKEWLAAIGSRYAPFRESVWDRLDDAIFEMIGASADGNLVIVMDAAWMLPQGNADFGRFVATLQQVAASAATPNATFAGQPAQPFRVLFHAIPAERERLIDRLVRLAIEPVWLAE